MGSHIAVTGMAVVKASCMDVVDSIDELFLESSINIGTQFPVVVLDFVVGRDGCNLGSCGVVGNNWCYFRIDGLVPSNS